MSYSHNHRKKIIRRYRRIYDNAWRSKYNELVDKLRKEREGSSVTLQQLADPGLLNKEKS